MINNTACGRHASAVSIIVDECDSAVPAEVSSDRSEFLEHAKPKGVDADTSTFSTGVHGNQQRSSASHAAHVVRARALETVRMHGRLIPRVRGRGREPSAAKVRGRDQAVHGVVKRAGNGTNGCQWTDSG